jgi:hypothetical protein
MARSSASSRVLTDHNEIREWAEQRKAKPARVRDTGSGDDVGIIRLDFPGYSGEDTLEEISWDDWFRKFDESNLALVVQERTANGELSNFNKLVSRDTVEAKRGSSRSSRSRAVASSGEQSRANSGNGGKRKTGTMAVKDQDEDLEDADTDSDEAGARKGSASTRGAAGNARRQSSARGRKAARGARSSSSGRKSARGTAKNTGKSSRTKSRRGRSTVGKKRATATSRKSSTRESGSRRRAA